MKTIYKKYQNEILTGVAIIIPYAVLYVSNLFVKNTLLHQFIEKWYIFLPYILLLIAIINTSSLIKKLKIVSKVEGNEKIIEGLNSLGSRYKGILDQTDGIYYLLGMSVEEFQREIPLKEYFSNRSRTGNPIKDIKILLLHPDSDNFKKRILEVNPGLNIEELVKRKKQIIRSLYFGLRSLPYGVLDNFEIRFFDTYPIWMIQFFSRNNENNEFPNEMVLMFHLSRKHSKYSPQYLIRKVNSSSLFESFLRYFEQLWEAALPMLKNGEFPKIYSSHQDNIRMVVLDFDGIIVESSNIKKASFFESLSDITLEKKDEIELYYDANDGLPRKELFQRVLSILGEDLNSTEKIDDLMNQYSTIYSEKIVSIQIVDGFHKFYDVFKAKYRFAIVSNAPTNEIETILQNKKIFPWFSQIYGYPSSKATSVKKIMHTFDLEPNNMIYIGDTKEDLIVADALGLRFIGRNRNQNFPELKSAKYSFSTYDELISIIYEIITDEFIRNDVEA